MLQMQSNTSNQKSNKLKNTNHFQLKNFLGKSYTLERSENYKQFLQELGIKKNTRIKAINSKPTVVLSQENDKYILSTSYPEGRNVKVKFKIGEKIQRLQSGTCMTSSVFHVSDNKLIEEQYIGDKKIVIEREFRKKDLIVMMEANDVQCYRMYTVTGSGHSVQTETSRRSSLWEEKLQVESLPSLEDLSVNTILSETEEEDVCY